MIKDMNYSHMGGLNAQHVSSEGLEGKSLNKNAYMVWGLRPRCLIYLWSESLPLKKRNKKVKYHIVRLR